VKTMNTYELRVHHFYKTVYYKMREMCGSLVDRTWEEITEEKPEENAVLNVHLVHGKGKMEKIRNFFKEQYVPFY